MGTKDTALAPAPRAPQLSASVPHEWLAPGPLLLQANGHAGQVMANGPPTPATLPQRPPEASKWGQALRPPTAAELDWLTAPPLPAEQDLSSIHVLSKPKPDTQKEEILEQCRDTSKLVSQLAAVLRGLEADVEGLRRENQNLKKTMVSALNQSGETTEVEGPVVTPLTAAPSPPVERKQLPEPRKPQPVSQKPDPKEPVPSQTGSHTASHSTLSPVPPGSPAAGAQRPATGVQAPLSPLEQWRSTKKDSLEPPKESAAPRRAAAKSEKERGPSTPTRQRDSQSDPDVLQEAMRARDSPVTVAVATTSESGRRHDASGTDSSPKNSRGGASASTTQVTQQDPALAALAAAAAAGPQWSMNQALWVGSEAAADRLVGKVRFLDKILTTSVTAAIDALNQGIVQCPENFCMVFSSSSKGFFLLHRKGFNEQAQVLLNAEMASSPLATATDKKVESEPRTSRVAPQPQAAVLSHSAGGGALSEMQATTQQVAAPPVRLPPAPVTVEELAQQGQTLKAEELMWKLLQSGQPPETAFDALVLAFDRDSNTTKSEEWLWRALEAGIIPCQESFNAVILAGCEDGHAQKVEDALVQMMRHRMRPSKEVFDIVIRMFADFQNAAKVEEWLLNAGQSGWTPEQQAFEAVVLLWAATSAVKAEEWLSRSQQTEYRLGDQCYEAMVSAFLREQDWNKASEWLLLVLNEGRAAEDVTMQKVAAACVETGEARRAEAIIDLVGRSSPASVNALRRAIIDSAVRVGDSALAERHLNSLAEADPQRTAWVASLLTDQGKIDRAKTVLQLYLSSGGPATHDIGAALLTTCACDNDAEGAEAAVRMVTLTKPLDEHQVSLLQQAIGTERAEALILDLAREPTMMENEGGSQPSQGPTSARRAPGSGRASSLASNQTVSSTRPAAQSSAASNRGGVASRSNPKAAALRRPGVVPRPQSQRTTRAEASNQ